MAGSRLGWIMVAALACALGCGGGGGDDSDVRFVGNIVDVQNEETAAAEPKSFFAGIPSLRSLIAAVFPSAVAQGECDPDAEDLLACALTGTGDDCEDTIVRCSPVDSSSCEFSAAVRVTCADVAGLSFVRDDDGDGRWDLGDEPDAGLAFSCTEDECVLPMCNGDVIEASNVTVQFFATPVEGEDGVADAEEITKERSGCTPTPTVTPTPTGTPTTTPSATATLPLP